MEEGTRSLVNQIYKIIAAIIAIFPFLLAIISLLTYSEYADVDIMCKFIIFHVSILLGLCILFYKYRVTIKKALIIMAGYLILNIFTAGMVGRTADYTWVIVFAWCLLIYAGGCFLYIFSKQSGKRSWLYSLVFLIALALFCRVAAYHIFQTIPVSDCKRVYGYANPFTANQMREAFIASAVSQPYYAWETVVLKVVLLLIGPSVDHAVYFNFFMTEMVIVILSIVGQILFHHRFIRFLPALLYAVYPSEILNDLVLLHENYFNLFFSIFILLFVLWNNHRQWNVRSQWLLLIGMGISLGVACEFKPVQVIVYISFIIVFGLEFLKNKSSKNCIRFCTTIIIFICVSKGVYDTGIVLMENYIGKEINVSPLKSVVIGLNTYGGEGKYDEQIVFKNDKAYFQADGDMKEYNQWALDYIMESWKRYPKKIVPLFITKYARTWGAEGMAYFGIANKTGDGQKAEQTKRIYRNGITGTTDVFALVAYILCVLGIVFLQKRAENVCFFMAVYIAGISAMLLLTEAQTRYKALIFLPICILSTYGIIYIKEQTKLVALEEIPLYEKRRRMIRTAIVAFAGMGLLGLQIYSQYCADALKLKENDIAVEYENGHIKVVNYYDRALVQYGWDIYDKTGEKIMGQKFTDDNYMYIPVLERDYKIKAWILYEDGKKTNLTVSWEE